MCSVATGKVAVDLNKTTLDDIVQGILRSQLGYSDEMSIMHNSSVIYDPDLEEDLEEDRKNLPKPLSELGITDQSFITIVDEDDQDQDPRVNVELVIVDRLALYINQA